MSSVEGRLLRSGRTGTRCGGVMRASATFTVPEESSCCVEGRRNGEAKCEHNVGNQSSRELKEGKKG